MALTSTDARAQLERALARGVEIPYVGRTAFSTNGTERDSAVLVLFGALDHVPATTALSSGALGAGAQGSGAQPTVAPDLDVLLTRRANGLRNHAGQIAFPGGGVEPGDADRAATALREAKEETGLDPTGVDVLGQLPVAHIPVSNYLVTPVLGWWRLPSDVAADHSESIEVFRVPVAELIDPAARATSVLRQGNRTFRSPAFRLGPQFGGHIVWGFTGILLAGLFDSLGWSQPWDTERFVEISRD